MAPVLRVAFFTDTFQAINGVALSSRQLISHAAALWRLQGRVAEQIAEFRPDIVHVVSPGDVSEIGVFCALRFKLPLAISWHTNLHEFGAMRLAKLLGWISEASRKDIVRFSEAQILALVLAFYRMGDVLYAPNDELVDMLRERTAKPVLLMKRASTPNCSLRCGAPQRTAFCVSATLAASRPRRTSASFVISSFACERAARRRFDSLSLATASSANGWPPTSKLRAFPASGAASNLPKPTRIWTSSPSPRTDTFGNVVLEAFASGVPAVVTDSGGPKFIVRDGQSGFVARSDVEFIERTARLLEDSTLRAAMGLAARTQACGESWEAVFEAVYEGYRVGIANRWQRSTA